MTARVTKLTDEVADYPLQGHERAVLTFLFPDDETSVTLEDLEKRMKKNRHFAKKRLAAYENFQSRASIAGSQLVESARDKNNSLRFQAIGAIILNVILGGAALFAGYMATNHPFLQQVGWIGRPTLSRVAWLCQDARRCGANEYARHCFPSSLGRIPSLCHCLWHSG